MNTTAKVTIKDYIQKIQITSRHVFIYLLHKFIT